MDAKKDKNQAKVYILNTQQPKTMRKLGSIIGKYCWFGQSESGPELNGALLERPEIGCAPTLPIQQGQAWMILPRRMREIFCSKCVVSLPRKLEDVIAAKDVLTIH